MSAGILYLAIVAIWACVLVPRWLRRPHDHATEVQDLAGQDQADPDGAGLEDAGLDDAGLEHAGLEDAGLEDAGQGQYAEPGTGVVTGNDDTLREQDGEPYPDPVAWEEPGAWEELRPSPLMAADPGLLVTDGDPAGATYSVTATYSEEVTYSEAVAGPGTEAEPAVYGAAGHVQAADHGPVDHGEAAPGPRCRPVPARPPRPSPHVLRARRRLLTMLIAITVVAIGSAFLGLTPWWTTVVPFLMLGGYLMLLREVARADAERARRWSEARARADRADRAARAAELARQRAEQAVAPPPEPTAEIINLSALTAQFEERDQLYDQYADAEIRAVGD